MPSQRSHVGSPRRRTLPCQARLQSLAASDHRVGDYQPNGKSYFQSSLHGPTGYHDEMILLPTAVIP